MRIYKGQRVQRLAEVWGCIKTFCELRPGVTAIGRLTWSMLVDKIAPVQSYPVCTTKAKEQLCKALATVWVKYVDEDQEHLQIKTVLKTWWPCMIKQANLTCS